MTDFELTQLSELNVDRDVMWTLGGEHPVVGEWCIDEVVAK